MTSKTTTGRRSRRFTVAVIAASMTLTLQPMTASAANSNSCANSANNTYAKLMECVTLDGVREHQAALQAIADEHNGIRTSGTPGYDASADYVASTLEAAGYAVTRQEFQFQTFIVLSPTVLEQVSPTAGSVVTNIMSYSGSGDVTAAVSTVSAVTGCNAADFAGFPAGNIALISRGACTFAQKATNAFNAGAVGAIIYNNSPGTLNGTLSSTFALDIPVTSVTQDLGQQLAATSGLVMRLKADTFRGEATTSNIFAETSTGAADNVVMVGSHLDSVNAGPGIQDNGSGSAAILEVAEALAKAPVKNKVRFAWWGAEESGLVGSNHYIANLPQSQRDDIALYLNFDMIGSPNHVFMIYDADQSSFAGTIPAGSEAIEDVFESYYSMKGLPYDDTAFSGRSDYGPFIAVGIPAGGLFTGAEGIKSSTQASIWGGTAGAQYDPCYHLACDTYDNVNLTALDVNSDAVAFSTLTFAFDTSKVNGVQGKHVPGSPKPLQAPDGPQGTFTSAGGGGLHDDHEHEVE